MSSKNVINVTKTISERHQLRSVSVFYHGMFNFHLYDLPELVQTKREITDDNDFTKKLKCSMGDDDLVCSKIFVNNQNYKSGDLIVIKIEDSDNLTVGILKSILIKDHKVYFVCQCYTAIRQWLRFFECEKPKDDVFEFIEANKIADFKPLILRGTIHRFVFTLHHHISFNYI